jgi:hypothetical protein
MKLPSTPEVATDCNCSLCRRIGGPWVYFEFGSVEISGHPEANFAAKLATVADQVDEKDPWAYDARCVTLYLSRLSAELTLKALLEKAGVPLSKIRKRSHDLRGLLQDIGDCEVEVEIAPGTKRWVPGSRVRAVSIDLGLAHIPIGTLIDAEDQGASRYPNEIRYGDVVFSHRDSLYDT